ALSVLTGASLFLLSPFTIPLTTVAVGTEAERLVENTIKTSVAAVSEKLLTDPRVLALARARDPDSQAGGGVPMQPEPARLVATPPSRYEDVLNAVVVIRSTVGFASGFFVSSAGTIITNHHVVGPDATVSVKLRNGTVTTGTVIVADKRLDLALVSIPQESPAWLEFAKPEEGGIGAEVIAIGTPEGLSWS